MSDIRIDDETDTPTVTAEATGPTLGMGPTNLQGMPSGLLGLTYLNMIQSGASPAFGPRLGAGRLGMGIGMGPLGLGPMGMLGLPPNLGSAIDDIDPASLPPLPADDDLDLDDLMESLGVDEETIVVETITVDEDGTETEVDNEDLDDVLQAEGDGGGSVADMICSKLWEYAGEAATGAAVGAAYGGATGALAGGVGAAPGALAGATGGALRAVASKAVGDVLSWFITKNSNDSDAMSATKAGVKTGVQSALVEMAMKAATGDLKGIGSTMLKAAAKQGIVAAGTKYAINKAGGEGAEGSMVGGLIAAANQAATSGSVREATIRGGGALASASAYSLVTGDNTVGGGLKAGNAGGSAAALGDKVLSSMERERMAASNKAAPAKQPPTKTAPTNAPPNKTATVLGKSEVEGTRAIDERERQAMGGTVTTRVGAGSLKGEVTPGDLSAKVEGRGAVGEAEYNRVNADGSTFALKGSLGEHILNGEVGPNTLKAGAEFNALNLEAAYKSNKVDLEASAKFGHLEAGIDTSSGVSAGGDAASFSGKAAYRTDDGRTFGVSGSIGTSSAPTGSVSYEGPSVAWSVGTDGVSGGLRDGVLLADILPKSDLTENEIMDILMQDV